jgi:hypothetical protein
VPALLPLLMASRSSLLMLACFLLVVSLNLTPRIQWRNVLTVSLGAVLISYLFAFLIAQRVEQSGSSMAFAARYSVYTYAVPLQPWSLDYINTGGSLAPLLSGYCSLLQYFLSGFFEFQYLVDLKDSNFAGGFYTFSFLPKLIAVVFGRSGESKLVDINADIFNPRPGVFQSFFGSLYIDFGIYSIPCRRRKFARKKKAAIASEIGRSRDKSVLEHHFLSHGIMFVKALVHE